MFCWPTFKQIGVAEPLHRFFKHLGCCCSGNLKLSLRSELKEVMSAYALWGPSFSLKESLTSALCQ